MSKQQVPSSPQKIAPSRLILALIVLFIAYMYQSGNLGGNSEQGQTTIEPQATVAAPQAPTAAANNTQATSVPISSGSTSNSETYNVYFNTTSLVYPDVRNQRKLPPFVQQVLQDLNQAKRTIDLAVFDLDLIEVTNALIDAKKRGVEVRVIIDSENLETAEVARQAGMLQDAQIPLVFDNLDSFMHNKFIVIDDQITWTGSWNITINDTYRNNNNILRFTEYRMAENFTFEFQQMMEGRFSTSKRSGAPYPKLQIGDSDIEVYFSPADGITRKLLQRLEAAESSIHFLTFSFTTDTIGDLFVKKHQDGLVVRGVFDRQGAGGTGAEYQKLVDNGIDVVIDGNCYILHHKTIIIDEKTVITGSFNFTSSAERYNDENLLIIDNPALAQAYLEEFNRTYAHAQAPSRCN